MRPDTSINIAAVEPIPDFTQIERQARELRTQYLRELVRRVCDAVARSATLTIQVQPVKRIAYPK